MIGVAEMTQVLAAPPVGFIDDPVRSRLADQLSARIAVHAEDLVAGTPVEISLALLRQARYRPDSFSAPSEPFSWKPTFSRRSLGLAVVRACVSGRFRSPAEAVGVVADEAVAEWTRTGQRTFYWEPWLAGLAPGARAVVQAEAVTWATSLWSSLDWSVLPAATQIGGPDDVWVCPLHRSVRLKGRCELRLPLVGASNSSGSVGLSHSPSALVSVSSGYPQIGWQEELGFLALVASLRSPSRPVPARAAGLWPDAGVFRVVDIDERILTAAARGAAAAVATVIGALGKQEEAGRQPPSEGRNDAGSGMVGGPSRDQGSLIDEGSRSDQNRARATLVSGLPAAVNGSSSTTLI
jgi:hypothetical protein